MRQKQAPFRVEDDIERGDITMATAATEDFHRESGDGLCGDFSCPHCAFSVDQDVMLKVLKHFFNCTSLQYIIDLSVGNAANLGGAKPSPAPRRASKAPQPHSEPSHRHVEPPAKRRATEARATPPQETPRIVTTQAPTLLARLNAAQSRTQSVQSVGQREIPSEPEHRTVTTRHVDAVQPRAIETTTTTAEIELPSIPTIKEEPGDTGASCVVEPTPPTLFDEPMHTQKETDSGMGVKRDSDNVGGILDTLPGTSSSGLFSEDLNFGGAGPSFPQTEPPQDDSSSGNASHLRATSLRRAPKTDPAALKDKDGDQEGWRGQDNPRDQALDWLSETDFGTDPQYKLNKNFDRTSSYVQRTGLMDQNSDNGTPSTGQANVTPVLCTVATPRVKTYNKPSPHTILIGNPASGNTYPVNSSRYDICLARATTGQVFLLKLMDYVFDDSELKESNFNGGKVFSKGVAKHKQALSKDKMDAIIYQTKFEFESFEVSQGVIDAINNKCRRKTFQYKDGSS